MRPGRLPILAGGTGLYIRTLIEGIAPVPEIDPAIRTAVRGACASDEAHAGSARRIREAAARLRPERHHPHRARAGGGALDRPDAEGVAGGEGGRDRRRRSTLRPLILLPPRDWLHARCDERFEKMFSMKGVAEVASLLARRLTRAAR